MTPLVLVPGLLCTPLLWAHQLRHLADIAECSVADVTAQTSIEDMAAAVLERAPPRFALAGLSMGGYVAHAIMRRAPERVERLALLDTAAAAETAAQTERRRPHIDMAERGEFANIAASLMPALVHPDRLHDSTLTAAIAGMMSEVGAAGFLRQIHAIMTRADARAGLTAYRCPTLLLCGREDVITPLAMHEEMAAMIPGARLAVIEQCGHMSTMEQPQAVTALLRQWLLY